MVDNIGLPPSYINLIYNNTGVIGSQDGDIQIALNPNHAPTAGYVKTLREQLPVAFPDTVFSFAERLPYYLISAVICIPCLGLCIFVIICFLNMTGVIRPEHH